MAVALLIFGVAAFRRLNPVNYVAAIILFIPIAVLGFWFSIDAIHNLGTDNADVSFIFYALFALVIACFVRIVFKYQRSPARQGQLAMSANNSFKADAPSSDAPGALSRNTGLVRQFER